MSALEFGKYCLTVRNPQDDGEVNETFMAVLWVSKTGLKMNPSPNDDIFYQIKVSSFIYGEKSCLRFDINEIENGAAVIFAENSFWYLGFVNQKNELTVQGKLSLSPELKLILKYLHRKTASSTT